MNVNRKSIINDYKASDAELIISYLIDNELITGDELFDLVKGINQKIINEQNIKNICIKLSENGYVSGIDIIILIKSLFERQSSITYMPNPITIKPFEIEPYNPQKVWCTSKTPDNNIQVNENDKCDSISNITANEYTSTIV